MTRIRAILRRSARYVLVLRGFILVEGAVLGALLAYVMTGSRIVAIDRYGSRADIVAAMVVTGATAFVLKVTNERVKRAIDRRFFREEYDARVILTRLANAVRAATRTDELPRLVARELRSALHPEHVAVYLRDPADGAYRCAALLFDGRRTEQHGAACTAALLPPIDAESPVLRALDAAPAAPLELAPDIAGAPDAELLLPISTSRRMAGFISLGRRLSGLPYAWEDRELLTAVATQAGFALENMQLIYAAAEDEHLRRELERAAEVQRRLFPQTTPAVPSLELAGLCRPALGVGGDYYDFIELDGGRRVGLAVADVAGKGMAAALLMSMLEAAMRSEARFARGDLGALVESLNDLLFHATDDNQYATFFYAEYDSFTRQLIYVNAGHNPPLLVTRERHAVHVASSLGRAHASPRATTGPLTAVAPHLQALSARGFPIGLFPDRIYEQQTVALEAGDVLVAYTDGVTEALDARDEEFGLARLQALLQSCSHLPASGIAQTIDDAIATWCGSAPQHDDVTFVVAKVSDC